MITRREFLKLSGLAAAALGLGYGSGKITSAPRQNRTFSLYGFLPADPEMLQSVVAAFNPFVRRGTPARIAAEGQWAAAIADAFEPDLETAEFVSAANVNFRLEPLSNRVDSDLLISDSDHAVYDPALDFPAALSTLRSTLRGRKADFLFSAAYTPINRLSGRVKAEKLVAVIRNEAGVFDHIPLTRDFHSVEVPGVLGKSLLQFQDGMVRVQQAACRNHICERIGWVSVAGGVIACAPNHLLVEIEST